MAKFKVLIIGALPPPFHGTTLYLKNLLSSKIREEFAIIHLNTSDPRDDLNNLGKLDFQNITLGVKNLLQLIKLCFSYKPQMVYLYPSESLAYLRDGLFILLAKLLTKAKIIQHMHLASFHKFYERSNPLLKKFIDISQRRVDQTLVLGKSLKSAYYRWHSEDRIQVVPNGIDLKINLNGKFEKKHLPVLYFLGNLLKFKGIHTIVQALAIVKQQYPEIQLKIAGKWSDDPVFKENQEQIQQEIQQIIESENLKSNLEFLGPVYGEDKLKLLKEADIFIYPSIYDAFPLVILEAMASGNPVIAVNHVGAIPDVVVHKETGILVERQDPEEIAEAIIYLIENPEERIKMGRAAFEHYRTRYTQEHHIDQMIKLFKEVLVDN
jgi:glycosyltransferase involved in cell wall biosynthesis